MIDLRPCPFCGNNVRLEDREFDDFAGSFFTNTMSVIECEKCGISMKRYPKRGYGTTDGQKQDLINSWNRRTELMLKEQILDSSKYQYKYDHTDCIWYHDSRSKCPVTCSQYRDGWNDAMDYIFKDGKGYSPYERRRSVNE